MHKKNQAEQRKFLKEFKRLASSSLEKAWGFVVKQADSLPTKLILINPVTLFQDHGLPPYLGEIDHGVMFCKDMVIGLKLPLGGEANVSYRLDFDPKKYLHVNFEVHDNLDNYPVCVPIKFSTGRFGFSPADKKSCTEGDEKWLALLELTKVKYWLKMTIGHSLASAIKQQSNNPKRNDQPAPDEQVFAFVQGKENYCLETVKKYLCDRLLPVGQQKIKDCSTEQALLQCVLKAPAIRAKVSQNFLSIFAKKDSSKCLLSGLHHVYELHKFDSEAKTDSEGSMTP